MGFFFISILQKIDCTGQRILFQTAAGANSLKYKQDPGQPRII
jgi:hypothetical protein